jgi:threonine aldolase
MHRPTPQMRAAMAAAKVGDDVLDDDFTVRILPRDYLDEVTKFTRDRKLATHLDGAWVFNAATGLGVDVACLAEGFDSVSVCLSKGLGAPLGSVLVGDVPLIARARRWRKMLGGGCGRQE